MGTTNRICTGHHWASGSTGHRREERSVPGLAAGVSRLTVCTVTGVRPRLCIPCSLCSPYLKSIFVYRGCPEIRKEVSCHHFDLFNILKC